MMNFVDYQKATSNTAAPALEACKELNIPYYIYIALGLTGEAGEVAEKVKKILRNKRCKIEDEDVEKIKKEIGDVMWYTSQMCEAFGFSMEEVAKMNIAKLADRKQRGVIASEGDNR